MFHSGTQRFLEVWSALPGAERVPTRQALDPAAFGGLISQVFMADRRDGRPTLRFAGDWIERLHGEPLSGASWPGLWREDSRALVAAAVAQTFREVRPVVIAAAVGHAGLEIALAPLRSPDGAANRFVGLYQPQSPGQSPGLDLRGLDLGGLTLRDAGPMEALAVTTVGEARRAPLSLAALNGRRVA